MKVLIIDDDRGHSFLYSKWLCEYEIIQCNCAEKGIAAIYEQKPHCILLDYHLPKVDGFQTLHCVKKDPHLYCPPVIFLSGAITESIKRNVMALDAFACFDKNALTADILRDAVRRSVHG